MAAFVSRAQVPEPASFFAPHPPAYPLCVYSSRTQSASAIKLHGPLAIRHAAGQRQEVYNAMYLVSVEHDMPMQCPTNDGTVVCGPTCVGVSFSLSLLRRGASLDRGCISGLRPIYVGPPCRDTDMDLTRISSPPIRYPSMYENRRDGRENGVRETCARITD